MAGDFWPCIDDPADQGGIALRHPSEREESGLDAGTLEQSQHGIAVALDAVRQAVQSAREITFSNAPT
jgi:hypothetical protein